MQADMELDQIMEQDHDLFFSEAVVEVDMGNTTHQIKKQKPIGHNVHQLDTDLPINSNNGYKTKNTMQTM